MSEDRRPSRRKRGLSEEDAALWSHVARGIEPVRVKRRVHAVSDDAEVRVPRRTDTAEHEAPTPRPPAARESARPVPRPIPVVPVAAPKASVSPALPKKQVRKIAKGHIEIDARIDLHGMVQDEAYGALRRFLHRCYASGHRHVLVITGKGAPERDTTQQRSWHEMSGRERGVLKRNVPRWLAEPELAQLVVSHTTAHARHGGDGALYVVLRNARKVRD